MCKMRCLGGTTHTPPPTSPQACRNVCTWGGTYFGMDLPRVWLETNRPGYQLIRSITRSLLNFNFVAQLLSYRNHIATSLDYPDRPHIPQIDIWCIHLSISMGLKRSIQLSHLRVNGCNSINTAVVASPTHSKPTLWIFHFLPLCWRRHSGQFQLSCPYATPNDDVNLRSPLWQSDDGSEWRWRWTRDKPTSEQAPGRRVA